MIQVKMTVDLPGMAPGQEDAVAAEAATGAERWLAWLHGACPAVQVTSVQRDDCPGHERTA